MYGGQVAFAGLCLLKFQVRIRRSQAEPRGMDLTDAASRSFDRNSEGRVDEESMKPTNIAAPDYFHKVVDCQWACPAHTPVPEYIRLIAEGRYSDAYMINWQSNVFPGILGRTCDRPCEPACRRGRVEEDAGRDLPPEARRRRLQGRHHAAGCRSPAREERQAHRAGRRRPGLARGRARSRPARLPLHGVRPGPEGRRHDADADSEIPPARRRDRRGNRLHPQPRHRVQGRQAHRQHEGAAGGELRRDLRRLRRAARPRARHSRPQGSRPRTSTSASTGCPTSRSATSPRSASASSCSAAATPRWTAAAPRAASAARTSR